MPIIAALGDIVIAFVALLLLYAAYQLFHNFLSSLVSRIPIIGGELARLTDAILYDMEQAAATWARDSVKALVSVILAPIHWIEQLINGIYGAIHELYGALSILRYVTIPALIQGVTATARTWFTQAEGYASNLFAQAQNYTLTLYNRAVSFTQTEVAQAESYASRLYLDSVTYTDHEIALTQAYAGQLYSQSIAFTSKGLSDLEHWTATSLGALGGTLTGDITALQKWITGTLPLVYTYVNTSVGAVEADLARLKTECTDNLCTNLSPLASLLGALGGDLGLAGLIALAAEAARDPAGTGRLINETFGSTARAAAGVMRATVGA